MRFWVAVTVHIGTSLIAFGVGSNWRPGDGIAIIGAHTDSPTLRVKPVSKKEGEGYASVGVRQIFDLNKK